MPELPLVVNLTVAPENEYFLKVESDTEEVELMSETVINGGGGGAPTYAGPYTASASTSGNVVLQTDGYLMNDDVTIEQLDTMTVTSHTLSVNQDTGVVTATASLSKGYNDTATTSTGTLSLSTQAAATITPTTSSQTAVAKGKYTTGAVTVAAMPSGTAGTPTATKGNVSNHAISVTPSVTNVTGYITGGTKTGTAVSVSASELVSGNKAISSNGSNIDVTDYATVSVSVPNSYSAGDEGKVVSNGALVSQTSATYTSNNTYDTTTVSSVTVNVSGGVTPTGTINITSNGTVDVTNYATAEVDVPPEYFTTSGGCVYVKNTEVPQFAISVNIQMFSGASEMVTFKCNDTRLIGGSSGNALRYYVYNCAKLKSIELPYLQGLGSSYVDRCFGNNTALETVTIGSVGYPVTAFYNQSNSNNRPFYGDTQAGLTITMYVDASTLADIPAAVTNYAPWGATNATIVYRNSTTGDVITS